MSVAYEAVLAVGVVYKSRTHEEQAVLDDLIDRDEIQDFPPAYDYNRGGVVGIGVIVSGDYTAKAITLDKEKLDVAHAKFKALTGMDGQLYLTPHGS